MAATGLVSRGHHGSFGIFILPGLCNSVVASRTTRFRNNINATKDTGLKGECTVFRTVRNSTPHVVSRKENRCTSPYSVLHTAIVLLSRVNGRSGTSLLRGTLSCYVFASGGCMVAKQRSNTAYDRFNSCMVRAIRGLSG